jgi:hypothetical protein
LAVLTVTGHGNDAEASALGTEDLDACGSQRIQAAFAIDDETICPSHNSGPIIRPFAPSFVNSEIPAIAQSSVSVDVERQHVQTICIVQKQRLFVPAECNAVRPFDSLNNLNGLATAWDVIHCRRELRRDWLIAQRLSYSSELNSVQTGIGEVHAALFIHDQIIGPAERRSFEVICNNSRASSGRNYSDSSMPKGRLDL